MSVPPMHKGGSAFAVRRSQVRRRADVNYSRLTAQVERGLAEARFELTSIDAIKVLLQYGISTRATEEPVGVPILRMNNLQRDG